MNRFRSQWSLRLVALVLGLGAVFLAARFIKVRHKNYPAGPFWGLSNHMSVDHFVVNHQDAAKMVKLAINTNPDTTVVFWGQMQETQAIVQGDLVWNEGESKYSVVYWGDAPRILYNLEDVKKATGDMRGREYHFIDLKKTEELGLPWIEWVSINFYAAHYLLHQDLPRKGPNQEILTSWSDPAIQDNLNAEWRDTSLTLKNFLAGEDREVKGFDQCTHYSEMELRALRRALLPTLLKACMSEQNGLAIKASVLSRFPNPESSPEAAAYKVALEQIEVSRAWKGLITTDWMGAYHFMVPHHFSHILFLDNLIQLASIVLATLVAVLAFGLIAVKNPRTALAQFCRQLLWIVLLPLYLKRVFVSLRWRYQTSRQRRITNRRLAEAAKRAAAGRLRHSLEKKADEQVWFEELKKRREAFAERLAASPKPKPVAIPLEPIKRYQPELVIKTETVDDLRSRVMRAAPLDGWINLWPKVGRRNLEVLAEIVEKYHYDEGHEELLAALLVYLLDKKIVPRHILQSRTSLTEAAAKTPMLFKEYLDRELIRLQVSSLAG